MIKLIYISNDNKIKVTLAEEDDVILSKEEYNELVNKSKNGKSKRS